jgi:hypothetical protein
MAPIANSRLPRRIHADSENSYKEFGAVWLDCYR